MWRHVQISTRNTWLHGNPKGFRHRHHDIHSSGDYKHPPAEGEHAGLHTHFKNVAGSEVHLPPEVRPTIGRAIVAHFREREYRVLAVSVNKVHSHFVVELPKDRATVKRIVGDAKRSSSRAVKKALPGRVWSAGCNPEPVTSRSHLKNAYGYVLYKQGRARGRGRSGT